MKLKKAVEAAALFACVCAFSNVAAAGTCGVTTVGSLVGTTCTIGDVQYSFLSYSNDLNNVSGQGILADSLILTPDASNPLDPSFTISGPLNVSAIGKGNQLEAGFTLLWSATVIGSGLEIGSATNSLIGVTVPGDPSSGLVDAGNNLGIPTFTTALIQTDGPNTNPDSALIGQVFIPLDGLFAGLYVEDGTGLGATTSATGMEYQYFLTPTPEPESLVLLGLGILGLVGLNYRRLMESVCRESHKN